jgi:regulatory protein
VEANSKVRDQALRLLKVRPRSEEELRKRLLGKGFEADEVETVLRQLKGKDLINDVKFAQLFAAQKMMSKPVGRRLLSSSLKAKGISPEIAAQAVEKATEGVEDLEVARQLALGRLSSIRGLDRLAAQRRLFGFLSRRGFSSEVVYRVVREIGGDLP